MTGLTVAEQVLLLSARENGGVLLDGYVRVGFFEDEMARLQRRGLFDGDGDGGKDPYVLTEAGAEVAAGLSWEDK